MQLETRNFMPGTEIQIVEEPPWGTVRSMVIDFDHTLSLLRDGWQDIMVPQYVEVLIETPQEQAQIAQLGEAQVRIALENLAREIINCLTGKQAIYHMIELADQVKGRGGTPKMPQEYKDTYDAKLLKRINYRRQGLQDGIYDPHDWIVPGSNQFVAEMVKRGCLCYLASGSDAEFVVEEAGLLGLSPLFGDRIYGAIRDYQKYSKEMVIRRILKENRLSGEELLVVGDSVVEIGIAREVGAVIIGVNSTEKNKYEMNANKRDRLIAAGAQLLIPDFRDYQVILDYLFDRPACFEFISQSRERLDMPAKGALR